MSAAHHYQDLVVTDFHIHFRLEQEGARRTEAAATVQAAAAETRRERGGDYRDEWRMAWDFPEPDGGGGRTWEQEADLWVEHMDRHGIDRINFVTGGGNDALARVVGRHPDRFSGFAHHDPFAPGAAEELERGVTELGLRGLKLIAPVLSHRIDDPIAHPVWETAERLGVPVLIHFGMLGAGGGIADNGKCNPKDLEPVATRFPGVNFVVPHFGIQFVKELLFLCWACPNVHVDTSGSNQWVRWMPYPLTLEDLLHKFMETIGPRRILFGSDSSWFPRGFVIRYLQDQIRALRLMGVHHDELQLIFGGNARRLTGLAE